MISLKRFVQPVAALSLVACMATGCSRQQSAIDAAKKDVTATGQPQEVVYSDPNGSTTLTMVTPPAPGSSMPTTVQTTTPAGTASTLPDWSQGMHPKPLHAARFTAPGVLVPGSTVEATTPPPAAGPGTTSVAPLASTPAPAPQFIPADITIPAGTTLAIRINQRIDVKHARIGDRFTGDLSESVTRDGKVILPRGTDVRGVIDAAHRRGHFKGRSILELRLTSIMHDGKAYPVQTADFVASKKGKGKRTAGWIGGTAGAGMLIGGIASGGVGLLAGGLAGGGLGTVIAGTTGNRDIVIPAESLVRFRLQDDLTVSSKPETATVADNQPVTN
ncbi:hypothetical protein [Terriglobus sp. RCC_193]|uniref:hypothetical protein n=1 Tax=Terriglobus sp. RCC_193 TaxID=3239218 RepID=UPI0035242EA9